MRRLDKLTVLLHSHVARPLPQPVSTDFLSVMRSFENQPLWDYFVCDGDGSWILQGLLSRSLVVVHDGSYMREVCPRVYSATYMMYCTSTGNKPCVWGLVVHQTKIGTKHKTTQRTNHCFSALLGRQSCRQWCHRNGLPDPANLALSQDMGQGRSWR